MPRTDPPRARLGVLFVHGIGSQRRGETLAYFGTAIVQWLRHAVSGVLLTVVALGSSRSGIRRWLEATVQQRNPRESLLAWDMVAPLLSAAIHLDHDIGDVAFTKSDPESVVVRQIALEDVRLSSGDAADAPAHGWLRLRSLRADGGLREESWVLAESFWAETFSVPSFRELALWGFGIVPWTIGSHFGARVRGAWLAPRGTGRIATTLWLLRCARAVGTLLASLILSLGALLAIGVMLLLAALPIPWLREALGSLQRRVAASLGDSYVLVARPVEAASIVGQVRRDLAWLAERCDVIAIVAHSQGAAVAYEAVRFDPHPKLKLLFTFGSGLRKLEELRHIVEHGRRYRSAAGLALAGLVFAQLPVVALVRAWLARRSLDVGDDLAGLAILAAEGLVGVAFLVAGLRDFVRGTGAPAVREIGSRLAAMGIRWVDCYASADPVPNGPIFDTADLSVVADGTPALEPRSIPVCNERSSFRDHNTYWSNQDQFVSLVVGALRQTSGEPEPMLSMDPQWLHEVTRRRQWRVGLLTLMRWTATASLMAAFVRHSGEWRTALLWTTASAAQWVTRVLNLPEISLPASPTPPARAMWLTAGLAALVLVVYGGARLAWNRLDEADAAGAIRRLRPPDKFAPMMALLIQFLVFVGIASGRLDWLPVVFAVGAGLTGVVSALTEPPFPGVKPLSSEDRGSKLYTERVIEFWSRWGGVAAASIGAVFLAYAAWAWVGDFARRLTMRAAIPVAVGTVVVVGVAEVVRLRRRPR